MKFLAQIRSGVAPDVYDRDVVINAEDFADAAEDAELRAIRLRGQVTLLKQCDCPRVLEHTVYTIPDGWAVVPKDPTPEMLDSTWDEVAVMEADGCNGIRAALYRAMLAAAPSPGIRMTDVDAAIAKATGEQS